MRFLRDTIDKLGDEDMDENKHVDINEYYGQGTSKPDMVNSPSHYNKGGIECIDAIRAALGEEGFKAYCRGNALKYTWRAGLKLDEVEDLKKAAWYNRMAAGDDPRNKPVVITDKPGSITEYDPRSKAVVEEEYTPAFKLTTEELEQIKGCGYITPTTTSEEVGFTRTETTGNTNIEEDDSILYVTKKKCRV